MTDQYYKLPEGDVLALSVTNDFPPLDQALNNPNGLIAIDGNLTSKRLLDAYSHGIFPWFSEGEPIMWWSPNPRMVLFPSELTVSNSLNKTLRKNSFELKINSAFLEVITACSQAKRLGQAGTWINQDMIDAYCELHQLGYAVSSESWLDGQLVGGCYGVIIGKMFYGESMFHTRTDASKVSFVNLVNYLDTKEVGMIDCQMKTPLLAQFGGREIPREDFSQILTKLVSLSA
ncbi:MAG TPA: leucyl/phenylalanyl-tRNA--protein transferase [Methylophilaceae bacterium]|jgi:leucyl/phenylalanyl-tRNA--protein transferase|nr:leucyl/phenylalanyl-tRNA--protein transferase [Methylophilaceae bacterium]